MKLIKVWIITGSLLALLATGLVVVLEVIENPGGIFQTETGIEWEFVAETALSWLVPLTLLAVPVCGVIGYCHYRLTRNSA